MAKTQADGGVTGSWPTGGKKVTDYDIVVGSARPDDLKEFIAAVKARLKDGWQPHGDTWESPSGTLKQPMVRT